MFLRKLWYFAVPGERLARGETVHRMLLGEPVLIGRTHGGEVFALRDVCPHRGMILSAGRMVPAPGAHGSEVECPYHGWRFRPDGVCAAIPSLVEGQDIDPSAIRIRTYPAREVQHNIWVYMDTETVGAPESDPPTLPAIGARAPAFRESATFHCDVDHAVVGLMDPAHGPFVHQVWWWRTEASIHEKEKAFGPSELGFTMRAHTPSRNAFLYKLLGGDVSTEIVFRLPGVRIEHIRAGRNTIIGLTTVVPVNETTTEVTQTFYWTAPWLNLLKPVFRPMARAFLKQDRDIVDLQQKALPYIRKPMFIDDADAQAKWYYRLKKNWQESADTGTPFVNPVTEVVLRWRS